MPGRDSFYSTPSFLRASADLPGAPSDPLGAPFAEHDSWLAQTEITAPRFAFVPERYFAGREEVKGITIDDPCSLDLDDAIWVECSGRSRTVHITIADAPALISQGTSNDAQAILRAATRYRRSSIEPMLPETFSNDLLSLHQGMPRLGMTISIHFDEDMRQGTPTFRRTWIASSRRLSHEDVNDIIVDTSSDLHKQILALSEIALYCANERARRCGRSPIDFSSSIMWSEDESIVPGVGREEIAGRMIVQGLMILANEAGGTFLSSQEAPALYRKQKGQICGDDLIEMEIARAAIERDPRGYAQLAFELAGGPARARYCIRPDEHEALSTECYVHLTSPIRRMPDMVNLRILHALLEGERHPYTEGELQRLADRANASVEREVHVRAKNIERRMKEAHHVFRKQCNVGISPENLLEVLRKPAPQPLRRAPREPLVDRVWEGRHRPATPRAKYTFPIGALAAFCERCGMDPPEYSTVSRREQGEGFWKILCRIVLRSGEVLEHEAATLSLHGAKAQAAKGLIKVLSEYAFDPSLLSIIRQPES